MHTPGPWHVDGIHVGSEAYIVARVEAFEPRAEREANARLIAAAPELLAVVADLVATWDGYDETGPEPLDALVEQARAAITKARGE